MPRRHSLECNLKYVINVFEFFSLSRERFFTFDKLLKMRIECSFHRFERHQHDRCMHMKTVEFLIYDFRFTFFFYFTFVEKNNQRCGELEDGATCLKACSWNILKNESIGIFKPRKVFCILHLKMFHKIVRQWKQSLFNHLTMQNSDLIQWNQIKLSMFLIQVRSAHNFNPTKHIIWILRSLFRSTRPIGLDGNLKVLKNLWVYSSKSHHNSWIHLVTGLMFMHKKSNQ